MNSLIVYCSSHGTTEKAARLLADYLDGDVKLIDLQENEVAHLTPYDAVIIGGSIHVGNIQRKVKKFISVHHNELLSKKIGLFLCCMYEGEKAKDQFERAFPLDLRIRSISNGIFAGEFLVSRMNFLERQIVKKVAGIKADTSNFNEESIKEFANQVNH